MTNWRRWQGWRGRVTYWKGWAAWQVYRCIPLCWLLPSVGDYAYWDDAMAVMEDDLKVG